MSRRFAGLAAHLSPSPSSVVSYGAPAGHDINVGLWHVPADVLSQLLPALGCGSVFGAGRCLRVLCVARVRCSYRAMCVCGGSRTLVALTPWPGTRLSLCHRARSLPGPATFDLATHDLCFLTCV
jgi:hypothetical protein